MIEDFKIYVTTLNEERLIGYTLEALLKVFVPEQILVIDIGSEDRTLANIPGDIEVVHEILAASEDVTVGRRFTELKAEYSSRQEWVLWVDGDEIYPTSSLLKMKTWLEDAKSGAHDRTALRLYWKVLYARDGTLMCSNEYLSAGPKLFNSNHYVFRRAWPKEVLNRWDDTHQGGESHKKDFTGVWFWHGVLLDRSSVKQTGRTKKLNTKRDQYLEHLSWKDMAETPWDADYDIDPGPRWTVINMTVIKDNFDTKWHGTFE